MPDSQQLFLFLTTESKSRLLQIGYTHSCIFSTIRGRSMKVIALKNKFSVANECNSLTFKLHSNI